MAGPEGFLRQYVFLDTKKALSARVGIAGSAILPFNPPKGMRSILNNNCRSPPVKGISIYTMPYTRSIIS